MSRKTDSSCITPLSIPESATRTPTAWLMTDSAVTYAHPVAIDLEERVHLVVLTAAARAYLGPQRADVTRRAHILVVACGHHADGAGIHCGHRCGGAGLRGGLGGLIACKGCRAGGLGHLDGVESSTPGTSRARTAAAVALGRCVPRYEMRRDHARRSLGLRLVGNLVRYGVSEPVKHWPVESAGECFGGQTGGSALP